MLEATTPMTTITTLQNSLFVPANDACVGNQYADQMRQAQFKNKPSLKEQFRLKSNLTILDKMALWIAVIIMVCLYFRVYCVGTTGSVIVIVQ
jgi:hypothetical protein